MDRPVGAGCADFVVILRMGCSGRTPWRTAKAMTSPQVCAGKCCEKIPLLLLRGSRIRSDITATESAPGIDNRAAIGTIDAANRHQRLARQRPGPTDAIESNHGIRIHFARCREHRPDGDVVRRSFIRDRRPAQDCGWRPPATDSVPITFLAPCGRRSSCPTWTPSNSAARQRSARSFMMSFAELPTRCSVLAPGRASGARIAVLLRYCRRVTPPATSSLGGLSKGFSVGKERGVENGVEARKHRNDEELSAMPTRSVRSASVRRLW